MKTVETGSTVKLCYRGKLQEARSFDEEAKCQEVEVEIGAGELMRGFEEEILGMGAKEKKTFTLTPERAYGDRDDRLERTFKRSELPFDFQAGAGEIVALQTNRGEQILATVKLADPEEVTLDLNHPLAGKSLTFEVEIDEIDGQQGAVH